MLCCALVAALTCLACRASHWVTQSTALHIRSWYRLAYVMYLLPQAALCLVLYADLMACPLEHVSGSRDFVAIEGFYPTSEPRMLPVQCAWRHQGSYHLMWGGGGIVHTVVEGDMHACGGLPTLSQGCIRCRHWYHYYVGTMGFSRVKGQCV